MYEGTPVMIVGQSQCVLRFRVAGDPEEMICILGIDLFAAAVASADVPDVVFNAWADGPLTLQSEAVELSSVVLEDLQGDGTHTFLSTELGQLGDGGPTMIPQNGCYLVHKHTTDAGRGSQGRFYVPGVPENLVNNYGVIESAEVANWNGVLSTFFTAVNTTADIPLVVNHGEGSTLGLFSSVDGLFLDPVIATQRRRLRS